MGANPSLFEDAKIYPVYFNCGTFYKGVPKFYPAAFHLLENSEGLFMEPNGFDTLSTYLVNNSLVDERFYQHKVGNGWLMVGRELRMSLHEMGDFIGNPSDWRGVHYFGGL